MPSGKPQSFTVFVARRSGRRFEVEKSAANRLDGLRFHWQLRYLAGTDARPPVDGIGLAQLALRRCNYMLGEMFAIEHRAPEASSLAARSVIETALIGAYLALNPHVGDEFVKKQASFSRRLRNRMLAGDMEGVLAVLADVDFLADPLKPQLKPVPAAPSFAQIASWLDQHPPFSRHGLATHLYDEAYSFLSNYVEHPTPMSLGRHRNVRRHRLTWRRFRPSEPVAPLTLTHAAVPAVAALASCLASVQGRSTDLADRAASEALSADGYWWSGSLLRGAAAASLFTSAGLTRTRADVIGFAVRILAHNDAMRNSSDAEQLVATLEAVEIAKSTAAMVQMLWSRPAPSWIDTDAWRRRLPEGGLIYDPAGVVAALLLVYSGLWPSEPASLDRRFADAASAAIQVPPNALARVLTTDPPRFREFMRRERLRVDTLE